MPIVGQFGSLARAGSFLLPGGAFESIATVTVGSGGASSIEFASLPSGFQHLQIRMIGKSASNVQQTMQLNGDTGSNYARHRLYGDGASAGASGAASQTFMGAAETSTQFGGKIIDILDYANTSKNKTVRVFGGWDANGSGFIEISSGLWMSTAAVTSIKIITTSNFDQYSTASLYGLRAP